MMMTLRMKKAVVKKRRRRKSDDEKYISVFLSSICVIENLLNKSYSIQLYVIVNPILSLFMKYIGKKKDIGTYSNTNSLHVRTKEK